MRRRDLIKGFVGSVAAWPTVTRAQQRDRLRRIGVLMALAADDPTGQARFVAFVQALQELGWTDGRNVQIDTRWAAGDAERFRRYAAEFVALAPDVILASGGTAAPYRSCSRRRNIRWAPATSTAWRFQAATPPVLPIWNMARAGNT